ncbi:hypothetical protein B0E48_12440 [Rhodanobacter sp. C03]|nr:hypothetical protein B0E48_12440 [Rhodanobacter sp. C03]
MLPMLPLLAAWAHAAAPSFAGTLCHAPETTYFSCETSRHKTISLCGHLPASLQYRYGTAARMDLQFPEQASKGAELLRYAHYSRFQTGRAEVTFSHLNADYAVFDYTESGKRRAGVHVTTTSGSELEIRCVGPIGGQLIPLGKSLGCDSDSALNGGACP